MVTILFLTKVFFTLFLKIVGKEEKQKEDDEKILVRESETNKIGDGRTLIKQIEHKKIFVKPKEEQKEEN